MSSLPLYRCQTESQPSYTRLLVLRPREVSWDSSTGHNAQSSLRELCLRATRSGSMSQGSQLTAALRMLSASEKCWFKGLFGERVPP